MAGWTGFLATAGLFSALPGCRSDGGGSPGESATSYQTGHALGEFVGDWSITGWSAGAGGERVTFQGSAKATRDKNYFVLMEMSFQDPMTSAPVRGTCVFAQNGGRNVQLSTWSSSSPTMRQFQGVMNPEGTLIEFHDRREGANRNLKLKMLGPDEWNAEVWQDNRHIEMYSFRRTGV